MLFTKKALEESIQLLTVLSELISSKVLIRSIHMGDFNTDLLKHGVHALTQGRPPSEAMMHFSYLVSDSPSLFPNNFAVSQCSIGLLVSLLSYMLARLGLILFIIIPT